MNVELTHHNLEIPYLAEKLIQRKSHKLERMLHRFGSDEVSLLADLSKEESLFSIKLSLKISGATMKANADNETIIGACGAAFKNLFRTVEEFRAALRRESEQKSPAAKGRPQDRPADKNKCTDLFTKNYHRFYNYALREIRFRRYQGFTKPGDITVRDVLNDALVRVADKLVIPYSDHHMLRSFYDEIKKAIDEQLLPGGTGMVPLEEILEPEDIDKEYEEYYQPDEIVKVEDIVIDENAEIPEKRIEYEEIESYIDRVLSQLPADWREAFMLVCREGLTAGEVAENRDMSVATVLENVEMARKFLREKLIDAGFEWKE